MTRQGFLAVLAAALLIAGCSSGDTKDDGDAGESVGGTDDGFLTQGLPGSGGLEGGALGTAGGDQGAGPDAEMLARTVIYFDFDSAGIRPDFSEVLAAHAVFLVENPGAMVRLEGHTDERGSREYNIGLGERRSQAVRRVLMLQGVAATQITTVSYGEEQSAINGSDEEAWSLNRRVELVYP